MKEAAETLGSLSKVNTHSKWMPKEEQNKLHATHLAKQHGLLRSGVLTHLSVLVLTSSVTVLETFHTNRNSRENICTHMLQRQGMQQHPNSSSRVQFARLSRGDPNKMSWRSRQHILKRTSYFKGKSFSINQTIIHMHFHSWQLQAASWLEAGMRTAAKWQLKQFPKVY